MASTSGPGDEGVGAVVLAQHARRVVVADELARVSSALPSTSSSGIPHSPVIARSIVVLPVPGGPSSTMSRPAATAASTSSSSTPADDLGPHLCGGRRQVEAIVDGLP